MSIRTRLRSLTAALLLVVGVPAVAFAQQAIITGKITAENGNPLYGAAVSIDAMNLQVGSAQDGVYSLPVPAARVSGQTVTLRVRAIGYTPMTQPVTLRAGSQTFNFVLKEDVNKLSQVVVTGVTQGTEQKKLPFTVAQVSQADMPVPGNNPLNNLQGKVPGAQIVSASGRPGTTPAIILRAPQSLNASASGRSQAPLLIVDGIIQQGSLSDINPQDIENIEIVKGASASTLYGSRAGNGVIQITTKSGKAQGEGIRFSTRVETGASDIENRYKAAQQNFLTMNETRDRFCVANGSNFNAVAALQNCLQTVDIYNEALRINQGTDPNVRADVTLPAANILTDGGIGLSPTPIMLHGLFQVNKWPITYDPVSQMLTHGQYVNSNVDMTGKFGRANFFASVGDNRQAGSVVFLEGYRRNNIRLNVDNTLGGNWTMAVRTYYAKIANDNNRGTDFFRITRQPAFVDLLRRDSFGRLFYRSVVTQQGIQNQNPAYNFEQDRDKNENDRFQGSTTLRWQPLPWIDGQFDFGFDKSNNQRRYQTNIGTRANASSSTTYLGSSNRTGGFGQSYNASISATVRRDLFKDLTARITARANYEQSDNNSDSQGGTVLAVDGLTTTNNATTNFSIGSTSSSQRAIGLILSTNFEFKERYIADVSIRRDGLSVFGAAHRWQDYGRASLAWRTSDEKWYPERLAKVVNELKMRYSVGQAGNRPGNTSQYETFTIGTGGVLNPSTLGNKLLAPEVSTEIEVGFDAELYHKYGLTVTKSRNITKDQILLVTPPAAAGFSQQWRNAGTLEGNVWEVSLNVPLIERRDLNVSTRMTYDQVRSKITKLDIPTQYYGCGSAQCRYALGEELGTMYGRRFMQFCSELPAPFDSQCGGEGKNFQKNDNGLIVWTGGAGLGEGITKNLWNAQLPASQAPYGVEANWGMPINVRDTGSTNSPKSVSLLPVGKALPDYRWSSSQTLSYKKLSLYTLFETVHGKNVYNEERAWSFGDFMTQEADQAGKSVADAKPMGYYWRAGRPAAGIGGLYDVLGSNMYTTEDASYVKLREVSVGYRVGRVPGVGGDWTLSLIGRNLKTWTKYRGYDPEVGVSGGNNDSPVLNASDSFAFPNFRTFTLVLNTSF